MVKYGPTIGLKDIVLTIINRVRERDSYNDYNYKL